MKELYILDSSYLPTAAATNRLLSLALALKKYEVKVTFFYLFPYGNKLKCDRYLHEFEYVYLWDGSWSNNKYINTIRSMRKFYKMMRPDIPVYVYSLLNCLFFLRLKKNVKLYHEYTENPEIVGKLGGRLGDFLYYLYKKTIPKLDGLFLITSALREKYINELNAVPSKTDVINMTVDINRFDGVIHTTSENYISYCGYISEYKDGVSVLIRSFAIVKQVHSQYKLRIIGPFENAETKTRLDDLVHELGVERDVEFLGAVSAAEMPYLLKSSKILALARPNNEQAKYGFATKVGEYLLSERPTVLTRVGTFEDFLDDKISCVFAKADDVNDFADKLIWTIDNYEEACKIGLNGKNVAIKCFNSEKEAEKVYTRIFLNNCGHV